ncbi:hypothetical protein KP509_1Z127200 [Ceratopteris richardii]|nr:hypothetical protein KP509_1Z127200 [Ceratopteris richardii]
MDIRQVKHTIPEELELMFHMLLCMSGTVIVSLLVGPLDIYMTMRHIIIFIL